MTNFAVNIHIYAVHPIWFLSVKHCPKAWDVLRENCPKVAGYLRYLKFDISVPEMAKMLINSAS